MNLSDLKIGDIVYYQATEDDVENVYCNINNIGFGFEGGGLDEPNSYYGITSLGNYLESVYDKMNRSRNVKIKVEITCLNPLQVKPLIIYQRGIKSGDLFYFPRFVLERLYDSNNNLINTMK